MNDKPKRKPPIKKKSDQPLPLNQRQKLFVAEYLKDLNATQAAIRSGYSKKTAGQMGDENLKKPQIAAAITAARAKLEARAEITQEMVLKRLWDIATADPNELIEFKRVCCHECYADKGSKIRPPAAECKNCNGEGIGYALPKDTRNLSPQARALYAGVKTTKDGLQVLMHDQLAALTKVGQHLGLFQTKIEVTGQGGGPIQQMTISPEEYKAIREQMTKGDDV